MKSFTVAVSSIIAVRTGNVSSFAGIHTFEKPATDKEIMSDVESTALVEFPEEDGWGDHTCSYKGIEPYTSGIFVMKPSYVTKHPMDTPWQSFEKETVAMNIVKLSHFKNKDQWRPFTWEDYVEFCSHSPSGEQHKILDEFADTGYLTKDDDGTYSFTRKIIGLFMQFSD